MPRSPLSANQVSSGTQIDASNAAISTLTTDVSSNNQLGLPLLPSDEACLRPILCPLCHKSFLNRAALRSHEQLHIGERLFACNYCSKTFNQRANLRHHERIHAGVRPYVCKICSKTYTKSTTLQAHLRTHTGERPYVCSYCGKGFRQVSALTTHKRIHSGERPYTCQFCYKSFNQISTLNVHERLHTGMKPFSCRVCNKAFNSRWHLQRHENVHVDARNVCQESSGNGTKLDWFFEVEVEWSPWSFSELHLDVNYLSIASVLTCVKMFEKQSVSVSVCHSIHAHVIESQECHSNSSQLSWSISIACVLDVWENFVSHYLNFAHYINATSQMQYCLCPFHYLFWSIVYKLQ